MTSSTTSPVTPLTTGIRPAFSVLAVAGLLVGGPALAHHGWSSYDTSKGFTITAPVETLDWSNPHAHLTLKHEGETWEAILAPLSRMASRGLTRDMLKTGATVSVYGYPSTSEKNEMRAERITVEGKTIELR